MKEPAGQPSPSKTGRNGQTFTPLPDLEQTARLLYDVYELDSFRDARYLDWLYRQNPAGLAVEIDRFDGGELVAHMAGVPQRYHRLESRQNTADAAGELRTEQVAPAIILLNIGIAVRARGHGRMFEIGNACFNGIHERFGDTVLIGVPNAKSTPGYTGRLAFRLVRRMPVTVLPPVWPSAVRTESQWVDETYLASSAYKALVESLDLAPTELWSQRWTAEVLAWRLKKPGLHYAIHATADAVLITTTQRHKGIPVCVIVKTFARRGARSRQANGLAAAACRFHRAPAALYAGFSDQVELRGAALPDRLKPAPLNLIVKPTRPGFFDPNDFEFERFEFFDFDAF
jgi:hypothetical protein